VPSGLRRPVFAPDPDSAASEGLSCSAFFCADVPPASTPEKSNRRSGPACCLLPSPRHDRLGALKRLSAEEMTRLWRSLSLRPICLLSTHSGLLTPRSGRFGSLLPTGVCYRALQRLPGQVLHLLEKCAFLEDAPCLPLIRLCCGNKTNSWCGSHFRLMAPIKSATLTTCTRQTTHPRLVQQAGSRHRFYSGYRP